MRFTYARVVPVTVSLGAGLLLGLVGPVAGKWDNPVCVAVSIVLSSGWPWACYAFLVGYFRRSKIESALLSFLGLGIGVITYYLFKDMNPTIPAGMEPTDSIPAGMDPGASSEGQIRVWGIAAFVFGAPVGLVGNLARTPGVGGLPFRLLVPLIAFSEATQRLGTEADSQGAVFAMTWNVTRVVACVVAVALMGHTVWSWRVRRSRADGRTEVAAPARRL
ncbi:hypothetical protein SSOG_00015 [Streptomyces himastatinicus ATCC 53653]|uniref:Uncharacterized protein n=1 Tax=Streptomyces himastatinicus ATCC 53653 TaxID=457427 RepID=D9WVA5_9ACTN|nr:hypothetical protein SSOG_00015 [Streptomyces himastatinicus ATCC 53653]